MTLFAIDIATSITIGTAIMLVACMVWLIAEFNGMRDALRTNATGNSNALQLKLQAYERLTLFAERAGIKNMVSRVIYTNQSAIGMQTDLLEELRTEFDYNTTQQIYVSKEVWQAVSKLKDQNIYIINQLAAPLPPDATAMDLSRQLIEYSLTDKAELNVIVLDAIQYEAKKLMN